MNEVQTQLGLDTLTGLPKDKLFQQKVQSYLDAAFKRYG